MTTPAPKPGNKWKSGLIGGVTGAVGATLVAFIFSSTTVTFVASLLGFKPFPTGAIIFVTGSECTNGWTKFDLAAGQFIVSAGTNAHHPGLTFAPSVTDKGVTSVKLEEKNLPEISQEIPFSTIGIGIGLGGLMPNGFAAVVSVAAKSKDPNAVPHSSTLVIGKGRAEPIDTLPPWIALTACQKT